MELYGFVSVPDSILITFNPHDGLVNLITLRNLGIRHVKGEEAKTYHFDKPLPLTMDRNKYGDRLVPVYGASGLISHFISANGMADNIVFDNFGSLFHSENKDSDTMSSLLFKPSDSYYLLDYDTLVYIVDTGTKATKYIIDARGFVVRTVVDLIIDNNNFTRYIGNVSLKVIDSQVVNHSVDVKLNPISAVEEKYNYPNDGRYGVIDLETYFSSKGYNEVYAAGFCVASKNTDVDSGTSKMFYINNNLDGGQVVLQLIDSLLTSEYHNYKFYAHNLSGYDAPFILKVLKDYNKSMNEEIYKLNIIFRDAKIISMAISKKFSVNTTGKGISKKKANDMSNKVNNKTKVYKITIKDSYLMLTSSLDKLGLAYEVDVTKGVFPHKFASSKTLFYIGDIPSKEYYNIKDGEYNLLKSEFDNSNSL